MNQHYYHTYGALTLAEQQTMLREKVTTLCAWIDGLSDDELFLPGQRQWATTAAQWPLWKWIHINTVAPFQLPHPDSQMEEKGVLREA